MRTPSYLPGVNTRIPPACWPFCPTPLGPQAPYNHDMAKDLEAIARSRAERPKTVRCLLIAVPCRPEAAPSSSQCHPTDRGKGNEMRVLRG